MKVLDRISLTIFSVLILFISVMLCILIFGWVSPDVVHDVTKVALNNPVTTNSVLAISIICVLLAIRSIFFSTDKKAINGIKDGILLQNSDGQLVISKDTLEELVNNIVKDFDSAEDATCRIVLDEEKNLIVNVMISVKETAIIKELSNNIQTKIKSAIKKTADLEVKEVNISIKELHTDEEKKLAQ